MCVTALLLLWTQAGLAAEVQGMLVRRDLNACLDMSEVPLKVAL